ncbi:hypothetical protein BVC71_05855 [Marivivens niveibacter]|uniref:Diguanylate cyclase n=1 Tax=Marivivens niveibacter TaxID=1930667 RepID=A0A251WZ23_9RHOB|nr:bifunctional diguanylate cyclase/phosphodiesterase [Marivivens niveibacter]OUD09378.1 hypothetical protein BVC71_05855 [Marivivens niveibacter]
MHLWQQLKSPFAALGPRHYLVLFMAVGTTTLLFGAIAATISALTAALILIGFSDKSSVQRDTDTITGLLTRDAIDDVMSNHLSSLTNNTHCGAIMLEIDRFKLIEERHDRLGVETIYRAIAQRLTDILRTEDQISRLDGPTFAIALAPSKRLDLEAAIQLSSRIQHAMTDPVEIEGVNTYFTVSIGFALSDRIDSVFGSTLLQAATNALIEAQRHAPAAIRSYSPAMRSRIATCNKLAQMVTHALDNGEITAFFQPQISTRSGQLTGFETLARWHHPSRGLVPPCEFLPALAQAGQMHRLGHKMIDDALSALHRWDAQGFKVSRVGVNFSKDELRDPTLVSHIETSLINYGLSPDRLAVEVLETVVADNADDVVIRNLAGLAGLGCRLDLDDFGTGHASITSIRRYAVERIKIDRSFVTNIDNDDEQQKMVAAILTMAERLGLDTLAEGVETIEERRMLASLGCGHVQGFGIARPMAPWDVDNWIHNYRAQSVRGAKIRQKVG